MLVKAVTIFLIVMVVVAMLGGLRYLRPRAGGTAARRCARCGAPLVGKGGCACGGKA